MENQKKLPLSFCKILAISYKNGHAKNCKFENENEYSKLLLVKWIVSAGCGNIKKRNCKSWLWKQNGFLMPPYRLINFVIQKYYQDKPRFNGVFSRDNLPKKNKG